MLKTPRVSIAVGLKVCGQCFAMPCTPLLSMYSANVRYFSSKKILIPSSRRVIKHSNPYRNRPFPHKLFLSICVSCAIIGVLIGQYAEIDEKTLPNVFVKEDIEQSLKEHFEFRPDLAAALIRYVYVYILFRALDIPSEKLHAQFPGLQDAEDLIDTLCQRNIISYGDALTLAAAYAVTFLRGPKINWRCGRKDSARVLYELSHTDLPSSTGSLEAWLTLFERLGFTQEEFVALLGAHTVGTVRHAANFPLQWTEDKYRFNNSYYKVLREKLYKVPIYPASGFLVAICSPGDMHKKKLAALPCEIAMMNNPVTKGLVTRFAESEEDWFEVFGISFMKLCELGWEQQSLREYIPFGSADVIRNYIKKRNSTS